MTDKDMYDFIDSNNLDNIEGVLVTLNSSFGDNETYKKNFFIIVYLLSVYFKENKSVDKLDFLLSDIATINYLKDKDIIGFIMSTVNLDNRYGLDFKFEYEDFSLMLETCKAYLDTKRSNYKVFDNKYLSVLVDLYANFPNEMPKETRELFFLVLYNNYKNIKIDDIDYFEFELNKIYYEFINDPYFLNHDTSYRETLYHEIEDYLTKKLNIVKTKVK